MAYDLKGFKYDSTEFFCSCMKDQITDIRVNRPNLVQAEAMARRKRSSITKDGKLTVLACDHPGRRVTGVGDTPFAMANRLQYLGRVLRVLAASDFDGVMGTTDMIEDLFVVNYMVRQGGGPSFLDEKVILGCMNRGGLAGTSFEMDDRMTSFSAESIARLGLDGAKIMFRLDLDNADSLATIDYCAKAVSDMNAFGLPTFIEPLPMKKDGGKYKTVKEANELARIAGVASALGDSSMYTWLKLPYAPNYEVVAASTSLPILMLGGEATGDPTPVLREFGEGMKAGDNVRGALVGRNVIFPGDDDPMAVAMAAQKIVHDGLSADDAIEYLMSVRGQNMDALHKYICCDCCDDGCGCGCGDSGCCQ
ncbi:MAG: class I fructose-bisphosphate aldolase [Anaerolineae bacterium]